jgi:hypothetical protein
MVLTGIDLLNNLVLEYMFRLVKSYRDNIKLIYSLDKSCSFESGILILVSQFKNSRHQYTNSGHHYSNTGYHYLNTGHHYSNTGYHCPNTGYHYSNTCHHCPNTDYHCQNTGHQCPNSGHHCENPCHHWRQTDSHFGNHGMLFSENHDKISGLQRFLKPEFMFPEKQKLILNRNMSLLLIFKN